MKILYNAITEDTQKKLINEIKSLISDAPLIRPVMPRWNKPFKTLITNAGVWGWVSDKFGYKYVKFHPKTNKKWPKIPLLFYDIWKQFSGYKKLPDCSLINVYPNQNASLGLHQDKDEECFKAPVVSISIGNTAVFKYGKDKKNLKTAVLPSGSIVVLKDYSRLYYHSISKLLTNKISEVRENSLYLKNFTEGRVSITLRRFSK